MRAHEGAAVALNAVFPDPPRHDAGNTALFVLRRAHGIGAVRIGNKFADRNIIALLQVRRFDDFLDEIGNVACIFLHRFFRKLRPGGGNIDFHDTVHTAVNGGLVHGDNLVSLGHVCLVNSFFHMFHSVFNGHDVGQFEERRLQHRVRPVAAEADFACDFRRVDRVEPYFFLRDLALYLIGQVRFQFFRRPAAVEEKYAAVPYFTDNIVRAHVNGLMAGEEIRFLNIVGRTDRILAETQV